MKVKFNYWDGRSEIIDQVQAGSVVQLNDGTGSYFMERGFTQYHFAGLISYEVVEELRQEPEKP